MPRPRLSPASVVIAMLLGATGGALASSTTEKANEITAVLNTRTSLSQAIAAAEKRTGGLAVKAELERKKGAPLFEINILTEEESSKVFVDPASGKVQKVRKEGFFARLFDDDDLTIYSRLNESPIKLAAAIASAEKQTGGKAFEAEFESDASKRQFDIETARNKVAQKVRVDATTGKVFKVAGAEDHDDDLL